MKKVIFVIILLFQVIPAFAQGKLSTEIAEYFYQPIKMEKIPGTFSGFYKVLPTDNIPYGEIAIFDNNEYPMKYFSNSLCLDNKKNGSIITLFNQEFQLGKMNNPKGIHIDISIDSSWWLLNLRGRSYICSLAAQRGAAAYSFIFLLFDITDKKKIKFYCMDTFAFDDVPLIGSLPESNGHLCILRTVIDKTFITTPYSITDNGFAELKRANGVPYSLKFEWSKWNPDEIKIIKVP